MDLLPYLGLLEEAQERGVLPSLLEDGGDVERAGGRAGGDRGLGLDQDVGGGDEEECGEADEQGW